MKVDSTVQIQPIVLWTIHVGARFNLGCQDGHIEHCNKALDFYDLGCNTNIEVENCSILQYANTLGFRIE